MSNEKRNFCKYLTGTGECKLAIDRGIPAPGSACLPNMSGNINHWCVLMHNNSSDQTRKTPEKTTNSIMKRIVRRMESVGIDCRRDANMPDAIAIGVALGLTTAIPLYSYYPFVSGFLVAAVSVAGYLFMKKIFDEE